MRYRLLHIAAWLVSLLTIASCSSDTLIDDSVADREQVQITFTINMGSSATRANTTWGDDYDTEDGSYYENALDPNKFQVLVFDAKGKYLDQLSNLTYTHSDTDNGIYYVVGTLSVDNSYVTDGELSCKLVVLANYDSEISLTSSSTIEDLRSLTFSYNNHKTAGIAKGKAYIPMLGMKTYANLKMKAGYRTDAGTIKMLRAMAKIRVMLYQDSNGNGTIDTGEDIAITSATMTNCNAMGYIAPKGFAEADGTEDLTMVDFSSLNWTEDNTFNPYPSSGTPAKSTLTMLGVSDTYYYLYVPEYDIGNGRPTFSVTFDFQTDKVPYTFDFDIYDGGSAASKAYNIERNHVYTFTIIKKKGKLLVSNGNWTKVYDITFDFGEE